MIKNVIQKQAICKLTENLTKSKRKEAHKQMNDLLVYMALSASSNSRRLAERHFGLKAKGAASTSKPRY